MQTRPWSLAADHARQPVTRTASRYLLDLVQAHAMRRQIGEALHAVQEAQRIVAPEEVRVHYVGRAVA
jgi:hypothetical protein